MGITFSFQMSVLFETVRGDIVFDLFIEKYPLLCFNFLKLCKIKYYNNCNLSSFSDGCVLDISNHDIEYPHGTSIFGILYGMENKSVNQEKYSQFSGNRKEIMFVTMGLKLIGSCFIISTKEKSRTNDLTAFGMVSEGSSVLNCVGSFDPRWVRGSRQNIRIKHTLILSDPFPDFFDFFQYNNRCPCHFAFHGNNLLSDKNQNREKAGENKNLEEQARTKNAKNKAFLLEVLEDLPDATINPPNNELFVCKLNQLTNEKRFKINFW